MSEHKNPNRPEGGFNPITPSTGKSRRADRWEKRIKSTFSRPREDGDVPVVFAGNFINRKLRRHPTQEMIDAYNKHRARLLQRTPV